jgi:NADH-quinone oxidoreductase subunit L
MWVPLAVLAILATFGGFVGVGPAFKFITGSEHPGGKLNIVNWLDPLIWNPATRGFGTEATEEATKHEATESPVPGHGAEGVAANPYGNTGFNLAESVEHRIGPFLTEWLFIIISLVVAGFGMLMGVVFYLKKPYLPDIWARRLAPLYTASYHKYWVDELYGYLFTRRTMDLSRGVYAFDSRILDGLVNGAAALTRLSSQIVGLFDKYVVDGIVNTIAIFVGEIMSRVFRASQTGFAPNYALVMVLGLVIAVAIFFSGDIVLALKSFLAIHF